MFSRRDSRKMGAQYLEDRINEVVIKLCIAEIKAQSQSAIDDNKGLVKDDDEEININYCKLWRGPKKNVKDHSCSQQELSKRFDRSSSIKHWQQSISCSTCSNSPKLFVTLSPIL